ncbi:hypothetical protein COCNU_scaffold002442G000010 [Cocos nucifera]|nr:hypothetical protein [Cocos nucifera]
MSQKDDVERFDELFAAFLELGHYPFAHFEANELREEHCEMAKLRAELALEKKEKRKAQEEVSAAMERAVQNFKSSKDIEDIKIDFALKAFLEGFQGHDLLSLVDADPLPQGVSFKPLIKDLKKKVHQLRKRLKRVEADLQASQKMLWRPLRKSLISKVYT